MSAGKPHPYLTKNVRTPAQELARMLKGSPFETLDTDLETPNQVALFRFLNLVQCWGTLAAFDPKSYQSEGHARAIKATDPRPLAPWQVNALSTIYAVPNGAELANGSLGGSLMKAQGLRPGIPDICVPVPMHGFPSYYIELKAPNGDLTKSQKIVIPLLIQAGHKVDILVGWRTAAKAIFHYLEIPS